MNAYTPRAGVATYRGRFLGPPPRHCQYIAGEASADDGCKCGRGVELGSSYCESHAAVCRKAEREVSNG